METRRQQLKRMFGFEFPDEFFAFRELTQSFGAGQEENPVWDRLGLSLVGPYDVLAGKFDGVTPRYDALLHYRYYLDLPEFCTILCGDSDGLHYGYWLDDPAQGVGCVASYYTNDAYQLVNEGDTLWDMVRARLERCYEDTYELLDYDPDEADAYKADIEWYDRFRPRLLEYATRDRPETGQEYTDKYQGVGSRIPVAPTYQGLGIVVPPALYRSPVPPVPYEDMQPTADAAIVMAAARQALGDGFPGTALQLGQDLWILGGDEHTAEGGELLTAAYMALDRPHLAHVTRVHAQNRNLPSVDILHGRQ